MKKYNVITFLTILGTALFIVYINSKTSPVSSESKLDIDVESRDAFGQTILHSYLYSRPSTSEVKLLLDSGVSVDAQDKSGATALHQAVKTTQFDIVKLLIEYGADVNLKNNWGESALHLAQGDGYAEYASVISVLLSAGSQPNIQNNRGETPLMNVVARYSDGTGSRRNPYDLRQSVDLLLNTNIDIEQKDNLGRTALMHAMSSGDLASVQQLLDAGASIDARSPEGETPLMFSSGRKSNEKSQLLLSVGADLEARDHQGRTPLMWSTHRGNYPAWLQLMTFLLEAGADIEAKSDCGWTPLAYAAELGKFYQVRLLLESGADPNNLRWTPLHVKAASQDIGLLTTSIKDEEDIEARDIWGRTPMMWAAHQAYLPSSEYSKYYDGINEFIEWFIEAGSEIDARDNEMCTALILASKFARSDEVNTLLNAGADINAVDNQGRSALIFSAKQELEWLSKNTLLIEHGANIDLADNEGVTALMYSIIHSQPRQVEALVDAGAQVNLKDHQGRSAFDYVELIDPYSMKYKSQIYSRKKWITSILKGERVH